MPTTKCYCATLTAGERADYSLTRQVFSEITDSQFYGEAVQQLIIHALDDLPDRKLDLEDVPIHFDTSGIPLDCPPDVQRFVYPIRFAGEDPLLQRIEALGMLTAISPNNLCRVALLRHAQTLRKSDAWPMRYTVYQAGLDGMAAHLIDMLRAAPDAY